RILPAATLMAGASALLLVVGARTLHPLPLVGGVLGTAFFGPALLILAHALVRPCYLAIEPHGVRFRFYSVECAIPWSEVRAVSAGTGWPALTFHDPQRVADAARVSAIRPLGWLLAVPTRVVAALLGAPLGPLYPTSRREVLAAFLANAATFGFHYGLPTSLLEADTRELVERLRRAHRTAQAAGQ
ncbi:MAG TPA: hypothetical protein VNN07_00270, partial [Candidatus Tectomicrobia bacterium]|nr:hypothetical protein [Candidatus Tectomicrobia bacterium]